MTTPSQTIGPFFAHALPWPEGPFIVPAGTADAIWIRGQVVDGAGEPVPDALIETWQADPDGRFGAPGFRGFGRCPTEPDGSWAIHTVRPGRIDPGQAPHVAVSVFARGLLDRVVTRIYLPEDCADDPVLAGLSDADRATLIARAAGDGYTFDIRLQGEHETVFLDL